MYISGNKNLLCAFNARPDEILTLGPVRVTWGALHRSWEPIGKRPTTPQTLKQAHTGVIVAEH